MDGYYYLHENGDLIYKRALDGGQVADLRESDLVKAFWSIDLTDREDAWTVLVEALAAGAKPERVRQLATKWGCSNEDAAVYAERVGCVVKTDSHPSDWFATLPDFVNLQESPSGWGSSAIEAMAELAKELGYRPVKTWGASFKSLCARSAK